MMERLTNFQGNVIKCIDCVEQSNCESECDAIDIAINRLKEYEDLNLTPAQLQEIDKLYAEKCKEVVELKEKLKEYEKAKLPCEIGDIVYVRKKCFSEWYTFLEYKPYVRAEIVNFKYTKSGVSVYIRPLTERTINSRYHRFFGITSFGKNVFLTREEAEQELKGSAK